MAGENIPIAAVPESAVALDCMNCGSPLGGHYCAHCGQEAMIETPTVGEFVREFLQDQMALEGKLLRTLRVLVRKPGQLTLDYIDGRRQRYIRPLRLYLTLSVVYFALAGFSGNGSSKPDHAKKSAAVAATSHAAPEANSDVDDADDKANDDDDNAPPKAGQSTAAPAASSTAITPTNKTKRPAQSKDNTVRLDADKSEPAAQSGSGRKWDHKEGFDVQDYDQLRDFKTGYAALDARINHFFDRPQSRALNDFQTALKNDAPVAVFFVLPLFAALLQIGYLRHHLRYGAHVLFSLHFHAFVFFDLLLANLASLTPFHSLDTLLIIAIPVYLVLALRRVYGGGNWSTGFWVFCMLCLHAVFIGIALFLAAIVSVAING